MNWNPNFINSLLVKSQLVREIKWQIIEKLLRSFTTVFISLLITTYFGPEIFGKYGYALALTNIFIGLSNLGMPNLIVAQISKYRINRKKIIKIFFKIRIFTTSIIFFIFILHCFYNLKLGLLLSLSVGSSFLEIFENYNQGNLNIINNCKSKIIAFSIGLILKLISIFYLKDYKLVLIIYSFEFLVSYFFIFKFSSLDFRELLFSNVDQRLFRNILKKLIPLSTTSLFTILSAKLDVLIIQSRFGYSILGKYNIFSQVILIWSIIPLMFTNYHMPRLAKFYSISVIEYKKELIKYGKIYFLIGIIISAFSFLVFNIQYNLLNYNDSDIYIASSILCLINIPLSISLFQASIIAINNLQLYGFIKTILNFIVMLFLSLIFSSYLGIIGLPIAINISYFASEYILPKLLKNNIRYSLIF